MATEDETGITPAEIEKRMAEMNALDKRVSNAATELCERQYRKYLRIGKIAGKSIWEIDTNETLLEDYLFSRESSHINPLHCVAFGIKRFIDYTGELSDFKKDYWNSCDSRRM